MRTKYSDKNKINVITLGCSKNTYDSEVLMGQLKSNNKNVVHDQEGNIVVINTCGFIDNAKQQSIDTILENVKKKNESLVFVSFIILFLVKIFLNIYFFDFKPKIFIS